MKNMKRLKIKLGLLLTILAATPAAFAEGSGAHGGIVVKRGTACYLADFAETGDEENAMIRQNLTVNTDVSAAIALAFQDVKGLTKMPQFRKQFGLKLSELAKTAPLLANILLESIRFYAWDFIDATPVPLADAHLTIEGTPYQVASRNGARIQIQKQLFDCLGVENEVGLIFHELLYALETNQDSSDAIRPLNGFLFKNYTDLLEPRLLSSFVNQARLNVILTLNSYDSNPTTDTSVSPLLQKSKVVETALNGSDIFYDDAYLEFAGTYEGPGGAEGRNVAYCKGDTDHCDLESVCKQLLTSNPSYPYDHYLGVSASADEIELSFDGESLQIKEYPATSIASEGFLVPMQIYSTVNECVSAMTGWIPLLKQKYEQKVQAAPLNY
jgi:hypothetical protein